MRKIYYSYTLNEFLFEGMRIPINNIVDVTDKYPEYKELMQQGYTYSAGEDGYPVFTKPDQVKDHKRLAKDLLHKSHHFNLPCCEDIFDSEQQEIIHNWRKQLVQVAYKESEDMPDIPPFIDELINDNIEGSRPLMQSVLINAELTPKRRKTKKVIEE